MVIQNGLGTGMYVSTYSILFRFGIFVSLNCIPFQFLCTFHCVSSRSVFVSVNFARFHFVSFRFVSVYFVSRIISHFTVAPCRIGMLPFITSPDPTGYVSYGYHLTSVVIRDQLLKIFSGSTGCFSFCPFSFGNCVVCPSTYDFRLSNIGHKTQNENIQNMKTEKNCG